MPLTLTLKERELFLDETQEFVYLKEQKIVLEHSLVSLSKWEAKWHKPFLLKTPEKTREELIDYIKCMTITQNVDDLYYDTLKNDELEAIQKYMDDPFTGTTFSEDPNKPHTNRETITSELIYYWMIEEGVPFSCEKWHLHRLFTLIRVCKIKNNSSNKKMSKKDLMSRNASLNAARRSKLHSKG